MLVTRDPMDVCAVVDKRISRCSDVLPAGIVKAKTRLREISNNAGDPISPGVLPETVALEGPNKTLLGELKVLGSADVSDKLSVLPPQYVLS